MPFRIATFNLENLDDGPRADPALEDRLPVLRPQLLNLHADVLCLQEINAQKDKATGDRVLAALDRLLTGTPYEDYHRVVSHSRDRDHFMDRHNLAILSRTAIDQSCQYWHDLVPPPTCELQTADPSDPTPQPVMWDRPLLYAEIARDPAPPLHVFNLHLRAPLAAVIPGQKAAPFQWKSVPGWAEGYYLAALKRSGQALEARLAVDRLFDRDPAAHVAVVGDFNADEYEVPLRLLRADPDDTGNQDLNERALTAPEHDLPPARRFTLIHGGRRQMLDHILLSRGLQDRLQGFEIDNRNLGDEKSTTGSAHPPLQSFHAPVIAAFDWET